MDRLNPNDTRPPSSTHPRVSVLVGLLIISHLISVISNPYHLETSPQLSRRNVR
jgi:hypothetical protein